MLVKALVTCVAVLDGGRGHISMKRGKTYNLPDDEKSLLDAGYVEVLDVKPEPVKATKKAQ